MLGNGSLLATLSERGRVESLFWPHLDRGPHLGELRFGLEVDGDHRWLDEGADESEQSYLQDANVLLTRIGELELVDLVHELEPVFLALDRPEAYGFWVAQDTGGAIKGANRFDTFWGAGAEATQIAGGMSSTGVALILVPKGTASVARTQP